MKIRNASIRNLVAGALLVGSTAIACATPVQYTTIYTIKYSEPNPTNYTGHALDVGMQYRGTLVLDDSLLATDGEKTAPIKSYTLNIGGSSFVGGTDFGGGLYLDGANSGTALVLNIANGNVTKIVAGGVKYMGDDTFIDSVWNLTSAPAPTGLDFYARLFAQDFTQYTFIHVAGDLAFERVPEPSGLSLMLAAMVGLGLAGAAKRRG